MTYGRLRILSLPLKGILASYSETGRNDCRKLLLSYFSFYVGASKTKTNASVEKRQ